MSSNWVHTANVAPDLKPGLLTTRHLILLEALGGSIYAYGDGDDRLENINFDEGICDLEDGLENRSFSGFSDEEVDSVRDSISGNPSVEEVLQEILRSPGFENIDHFELQGGCAGDSNDINASCGYASFITRDNISEITTIGWLDQRRKEREEYVAAAGTA